MEKIIELKDLVLKRKFTLPELALWAAGIYIASRITLKLLALPSSFRAAIGHKKIVALAKEYRIQKLKEFEDSRSLIPEIKLSPELQEQILNADVAQLKEMLASKRVTSVELLSVFYHRSLKYNPEFNFLTDTNIKEALELAKKCDEDRANSSPRAQGLLFGIPVSIKESFGQKGFVRTGGLCELLATKVESDSITIELLKAEGAIPFVRTNLPQGLSSIISYNRIHGETTNPWNKARSAGGSSGGEGAIVACRASPLGIGSDIGGSIRIPAAFCGVYGFKPTGGRTSMIGHIEGGPTGKGQLNFIITSGPIGKSVNDLELACHCLMPKRLQDVNAPTADFTIPVSPWRHEETHIQEGKTLTFGYFETLDCVPASRAARRAVRETIEKLQAKGHKVIKLDTNVIDSTIYPHFQLITADEFEYIKSMTGREKLIEHYDSMTMFFSLGPLFKKILCKLFVLSGQAKAARLFRSMGACSLVDYLKASCDQVEIRRRFIQQLQKQGIDAIVCPAYPIPAIKSESAKFVSITVSYTTIFNFFGMPAGTLPITTVKEGEDVYDEKCGKSQDFTEKKIAEDMRGTVGLPMGIQVATLPWQDEKCIAMMRIIEELVPFYKQHPLPV